MKMNENNKSGPASAPVVQCPLCLQPARVLYQSELCQWGDNADNSTKGWQCGCDKCDHLFFVSRKQMALNIPTEPPMKTIARSPRMEQAQA